MSSRSSARDTRGVTVRDLSVQIGGTTILEGASFDVRAGDKVGLVGRNGAGKTTLLRVLAGASEPHAGTVVRSDRMGYLSQDPRSDSTPTDTVALSHVLSARGLDEAADQLEKLRVALEEDTSDRSIRRFASAQERFEALGGYAAESEVRKLADGLGLASDRLDLPVGALSGGERRRVELVRILFGGSDALLLDEPTNHLDASSRDWLLRFLRAYGGALVVVSHDLGLLDDSITRVLHLDRAGDEAQGQVVEYRGTYSQYLRAREADEERTAKLATRQAKEISRLNTLADSMRGQTARRARVAKSLDVRARRLEEAKVEGPARRRSIQLQLPDPPPCGRTVLEVGGLWKAYGSLDVFSDVAFDVGRGERMLVMGFNGAGKTTLLKILADRIQPDLGAIDLDSRATPGYFAQEHEGIVAGSSLIDHMRTSSDLGDGTLRSLLGMFGLSGDKAFQDAASLSGGEKTKLALAQLVAGRFNLLLLDEPTNNLDPQAREAVGTALASWPGTMVVVSHDREFVRTLEPDRVVTMPDGTVDHFSEEMLDLVELT